MPTHYFRVDGADQETGEETYLVLQADSKPHAEKIARQQGLLISSVRVAKREDWEAALSPVQEDELAGGRTPAESTKPSDPKAPDNPLTFVAGEAIAAPSSPAPALTPAAANRATGGSAAAIMLAFVGAALVIGGVLALVLALWPDTAARNELQQLDFRLHNLSQCIIGAMLVICGAIALLLAGICYVVPRSMRAT